MSDSTVDVGEQTQFRINVINGDVDDSPRAPVVDGLTIRSAGHSTSSQYTLGNNGLTQTVTTTFLFVVVAGKPGQFVIPGQEVHVDGTIERTLPVTLTVLDDGSGGQTGTGTKQPVFFELIVPKKTAYVGETVPIEARASYGPGVLHQPDPYVILNGDGFSVEKFVGAYAQGIARPGHSLVDIYKSAVTGLKIGEVTIGPATITPIVRLPYRSRGSRGYYDPNDPFADQLDAFNAGPQQQIELKSSTVTLEIKPLPEAGKPANFSGAVGQFKLEAEAVPNKAQMGDPVTIRLRLSGKGNFDRIAAPVLDDDRGLRTYPPTSKFKADDEVNLSGVKTFEQVVIAEGPRTSLPACHFSYFDPATARYVTLDTPPLAVKIEGGSLATPTPTPQTGSGTVPVTGSPTPTPVSTPRRPAEDILYIRTDPGADHGAGEFLPVYRRQIFWEVQGGVFAGLLALGIVAARRAKARNAVNQRAARLARQQGDLQRVLGREDSGRREFYTAAARLAQLRAGASAGQTNTSLSAADIARLKGLDPQTAGAVHVIFDRHEEFAYSGNSATETPIPAAERREVLDTLETIGRH